MIRRKMREGGGGIEGRDEDVSKGKVRREVRVGVKGSGKGRWGKL